MARWPARLGALCAVALVATATLPAKAQTYANFESSHVHPIAVTPSGDHLLVVNTPDATLEVYSLDAQGTPTHVASIPVGLEPVGVTARNDTEAWVSNHLSDTVSIVDLTVGTATRTLVVGDEPTDVAFAGNRAFVAVSQEDAVKVFDLATPNTAPTVLELFSMDLRALAVSPDGQTVYAIPQNSGNQTTVIRPTVIFFEEDNLDPENTEALGVNRNLCNGAPPTHPPLPEGIERNPDLPSDGRKVRRGLIVKFDKASGEWRDETGQDWSACLPYRLPDKDLFAIDVTTLAVTTPASGISVGTTLFDVSVNPATGQVYVPHTEALNQVRFAHPLALRGHFIENRLAVIDPAQPAPLLIDLNGHIDRASTPPGNLAEREASISQAGMMAWASDGSVAYLTAIGSRKLFRLNPACQDPSCLFGANRASPDAVEVGEGPTGVALLESANRLYVVNRFSNSIAIVDSQSMTKLDEIAMSDPSSDTTKQGRRFLYDGIVSSQHGDSSCASCHLFGDSDQLAWDLGNPEGDLALYTNEFDNVRFTSIAPDDDGVPGTCDPLTSIPCAEVDGFDPQKGPMMTQTLRSLIEPLHWRGDQPTILDFNGAFVDLMGAEDVGPVNGKSGGLSAEDIALVGQFQLDIRMPPNPNREIDDTLPLSIESYPARGIHGDPRTGEKTFLTYRARADGGLITQTACGGCHPLPFGTVGGTLGGVTPTEPTSDDAAALVNAFRHSEFRSLRMDLKIPHLRNLYEKDGPVFGDHTGTPPDSKSGFAYGHDGGVPNIRTWLASDFFEWEGDFQQAHDVAAFLMAFPTETRPAVGQLVTFPPGPAPTGSGVDENLLDQLVLLGDASDPEAHCELTVRVHTPTRHKSYRLFGGQWIPDVALESPVDTSALRQNAEGQLSFLCATLGAGERLGGDRDVDGFLNGDDNCPAAANGGQEDADGDGTGDACDATTVPPDPAPEFISVSLGVLSPGQRRLIKVTGRNFVAGTTVESHPESGDLQILNVTFASSTRIRVVVRASRAAELGSLWSLEIENPDGQSITATDVITVE